jgi:hypothetical protein
MLVNLPTYVRTYDQLKLTGICDLQCKECDAINMMRGHEPLQYANLHCFNPQPRLVEVDAFVTVWLTGKAFEKLASSPRKAQRQAAYSPKSPSIYVYHGHPCYTPQMPDDRNPSPYSSYPNTCTFRYSMDVNKPHCSLCAGQATQTESAQH